MPNEAQNVAALRRAVFPLKRQEKSRDSDHITTTLPRGVTGDFIMTASRDVT